MGRKTKGSIPALLGPAAENVKFSFKHLDIENSKYHPQKCCRQFFSALVLALTRYSKLTTEQFREQNNEDGRHCHYFPDTSEPNGFTCLNDPDGLEMEEAWQIRLCPDMHEPPESAWRIHGVLLADVFYVIWLDYDHLLYNNPKFGPGN
jgi:hypothetical protein